MNGYQAGVLERMMPDLEELQLQIWQGSTELFRGWALGETSPQDIESVLEVARDKADWQTLAVCAVVISAMQKTTGVTPWIKSDREVNSAMETSIPYSMKSEFSEPIETAIRKVGGMVIAPLQIALKPGGYSHDSRVLIRQPDCWRWTTVALPQESAATREPNRTIWDGHETLVAR